MPWGWDREHTDSARPYTLDELAARTEAPHSYAYPTAQAYEEGWRLWRAIRRDERVVERDAHRAAIYDELLQRLTAEPFGSVDDVEAAVRTALDRLTR